MGEIDTKVNSKGYKEGFKEGIPIGLGYVPISMACGIAACKARLGFGLAQLMSMLLYTASGQGAALTLLNNGETAIIMYALTMFVMNFRYVIFSMSITQRFDKSMNTFQRAAFGLLNTDEIFGVAMKEKGDLRAPYLFGLATVPYLGFVLGNMAGCLSAELLPVAVSSALGIMIYAMFMAIIVPPARESRPVLLVVLLALAASFIMEYIPVVKANLKPGVIVIICAVVTASIGALLFPVEEEEAA